ncbi:50S ribosomal protein L24 [Candidatus Woesearchaeota archaeon]|nr:50S ribosomal protein L24 [Candidatus Woesearchaeota archaeon]
MKQKFSALWKSSTQVRKQRKYRYNAPLHILGKFLHSHLSKELRKEYGIRNLRVRTGDKVKIMRGNYKGAVGKILTVNVKNSFVTVEKTDRTRKDGTKSYYPFDASKVQIISLYTDDKQRAAYLQSLRKENKNENKNESRKDEKQVKEA